MVCAMEESEAVAAIVTGDAAGLAEALDVYATPLFAYCRSILPQAEAADVVEDTFVVARTKLDGLLAPARVGQWLQAVARNECFRRIIAVGGTPPPEPVTPVPGAILPDGLRGRIMKVCTDDTPAGRAHRTTVTHRSGQFGYDGFPKPVTVARPRRVSRVVVAAAAVVGAGAVFNGQVVGDGSNDTLVLAAGKHAGNLQGLGTQFTGITTIDEAAKANWTLTGGAILQSGQTLNVDGALTISGTASGGGTAVIESGATLMADGALSVTSVQFSGGTESLVLGSATSVTSTLSGFGIGDTIDLVKLVANGERFADGTLTLLSGSTQVAQLALAGNYTSNNFTLTSDGHGGTDIGFVAGAHAAMAQDFGLPQDATDWLPQHVPAESGGLLDATITCYLVISGHISSRFWAEAPYFSL